MDYILRKWKSGVGLGLIIRFINPMHCKNEVIEKMRDLRDSWGMKKPSHVLEYPLVVRKVLENMTVSVPDLSIWTTLPMPPKKKTENGYVTQFNDEYALLLGREILRTYSKASKHMREKKWVPNASDIKSVVTKQEKPMTLPAFARLINQVISISEDTIARDIEKGIIKCSKTSGGHRRIPGSEVGSYLAYLEQKTKPRRKKSLIEAMTLVEKDLKKKAAR